MMVAKCSKSFAGFYKKLGGFESDARLRRAKKATTKKNTTKNAKKKTPQFFLALTREKLTHRTPPQKKFTTQLHSKEHKSGGLPPWVLEPQNFIIPLAQKRAA